MMCREIFLIMSGHQARNVTQVLFLYRLKMQKKDALSHLSSLDFQCTSLFTVYFGQ